MNAGMRWTDGEFNLESPLWLWQRDKIVIPESQATFPCRWRPPWSGRHRSILNRPEHRVAGYIVRRLIQAIPILFGVAIISFALVYLAPGDPIDRFRPRLSGRSSWKASSASTGSTGHCPSSSGAG